MMPEKKVLALIFIVALTLRLIAVINLPVQYQTPGGDAKRYDYLAVDLLAGKGYVSHGSGLPTSWRPPLYPLFLASIYSIFGHNYLPVRVVQSIISALLCIVIFYIAKRVFDRRVAFLSAVTLALYQPYILYAYFGGPGFLLPEIFLTFLIALLTLSLIKGYFVRPSIKNGIIAGILLGLTVLTRPLFVMFPVFLFVLLMCKDKHPILYRFKKTSLLFITFTLVIMPWLVRNYFVHNSFPVFATESGHCFLAGNNPNANGSWTTNFDGVLTEEEREEIRKMPKLKASKAFYRVGIKYLVENYQRIPKLFFKKLLVLWDVYTTDYDVNANATRVYNIWYSIVLMFGLIGIIHCIRFKLNVNIVLLLSLFLYFSVICMIFFSETRFRSSVEPFLIIFSGAGIFAIYDRFKNKFLSYGIIAVVIGINFLLYAYSDSILNWVRALGAV